MMGVGTKSEYKNVPGFLVDSKQFLVVIFALITQTASGLD